MRKEDCRPENFSPYWEIPFEEMYPDGDPVYFATDTPDAERQGFTPPTQTEKLISKIQKHMEIIYGKTPVSRNVPPA